MPLETVTLENTDETLTAHPRAQCEGEICCIHNRTEHCMRSFPQHWRSDRGIMERICRHGVGHPDPDDWQNTDTVHGCCSPPCCGSVEMHEMPWWDELSAKLNVDNRGTPTDPYAEIENLRNALTLALERETRLETAKLTSLSEEIQHLKKRVTSIEKIVTRVAKLLRTQKDAYGTQRCLRCGGEAEEGRACTGCIREEEYET